MPYFSFSLCFRGLEGLLGSQEMCQKIRIRREGLLAFSNQTIPTGTGAEVRLSIVSGIVMGDGQLLANFFSVSLVTVQEVVAKVYPPQVPSRLIDLFTDTAAILN